MIMIRTGNMVDRRIGGSMDVQPSGKDGPFSVSSCDEPLIVRSVIKASSKAGDPLGNETSTML